MFVVCFAGIDKMTEKSPASSAHIESPMEPHLAPLASPAGTESIQPAATSSDAESQANSLPESSQASAAPSVSPTQAQQPAREAASQRPVLEKTQSMVRLSGTLIP